MLKDMVASSGGSLALHYVKTFASQNSDSDHHRQQNQLIITGVAPDAKVCNDDSRSLSSSVLKI